MWTVLFDIDGTLVRCGGAGMEAMGQTIREVYGIQEIPKVDAHGRTDHGIISELVEKTSLDLGGDFSSFGSAYCERLPSFLKLRKGAVLPNVVPVLEQLNAAPNVVLGVLTGNLKEAANLKLDHFGLREYFLFGGFGDSFSDRNEVAKEAANAASDYLKTRFDPGKIWVIGDTPNDIRCARAINAKVLAVGTGGGIRETLESSDPDLFVEDLTDADQWLAGLIG